MIKIDIEMPINCIKCPCSSYEYWWCEVEGRDLSEAELTNNRPDWCPLSECEFCGGVSKAFGASSPLLEKK